ncbi:hypothetical protein [Streptomyces sp. SPB162]|uniref:hypothetical protein n=1 Tax=Streptomyces sp. SPB162 TaxID=2940560 RepID=UPI002406BBC9|nr:hypothetical protein [Streptomyces sp. SPB162]
MSQIQDLKPETVVAAHRRPEAPDNAQVLADTIAYIQDADRILEGNPTAAQFIEHMLDAHPTRLNPTTVLYSAAALGLK